MASSFVGKSAHANHYVDYVLHYRFGGSGKLFHRLCRHTAKWIGNSQATDQLELLLRKLSDVGLQSEVRQGDETSLLVFVRASEKVLRRAVYQSRFVDPNYPPLYRVNGC